MLNAYRIFLIILLQSMLCITFWQWVTLHPVLVALGNHPDIMMCNEAPKEKNTKNTKNTEPDASENPPLPTDSVQEFRLTDLECKEVDIDKEGLSKYTHLCKFVKHNASG